MTGTSSPDRTDRLQTGSDARVSTVRLSDSLLAAYPQGAFIGPYIVNEVLSDGAQANFYTVQEARDGVPLGRWLLKETAAQRAVAAETSLIERFL